MKKLLLLAVFGFTASAAFSQNVRPANVRQDARIEDHTHFNTPAQNRPENTGALWSFNFSNATGMSVVRGAGGAASSSWYRTSALPSNLSGFGTTLNSTSGAPFAIINSDSFTSGTQDDYLILKVGANLTSNVGVQLRFQHYFRRFQEDHIVQVSNDSTNWTTVYNSDGIIPVNTTITNVTNQRFNISAVAGGQANVWVRFHYVGAWDWFWAIDDVEIDNLPGNDLTLENYAAINRDFLGFYGRYPSNQLTDSLFFEGAIQNFGLNSQPNVKINSKVERNGNVIFNNNSASVNMTSGLRDTLLSTANFPLAAMNATGSYTVTITTSSDSTDGTPLDNTVSFPIGVTDTVMSVLAPTISRATTLGTLSFTNNADGIILASMIELGTADTITAIRLNLGVSTPGAVITVSVRDTNGLAAGEYANPLSFPVLAESESYTLTAADTTRGFAEIPIPATLFGTPQNRVLQPGPYFVAAELISNAGANHVRVVDDLTYESFMPFYSSIIFLPTPPGASARWYTNGVGLGVSGVFGRVASTSSVSELDNRTFKFNHLYPNPAKNEVNVSFRLKESANVTIRVRDLAGRIVAESNEGMLFEGGHKSTIALNSLNAGMYFVELNANGAVASQKLVVTK